MIGVRSRRWRRPSTILVMALVSLTAFASCGGNDDQELAKDSGEPPTSASSFVDRSIERTTAVAGILIVAPTATEAGTTVRVSVENAGTRPIYYGLDNRIQRRVMGRWKDATEAVYGTPSPAVRSIRLIAPPGERTGPDYDSVTDRVPLPPDLAPGVYRVTKRVSGDESSRSQRATLAASFTVRSPRDVDGGLDGE